MQPEPAPPNSEHSDIPDRPNSATWTYLQVLRQSVSTLEGAKVPFLICGGLASKMYGKRRVTRDIDVFVKPSDAGHAIAVLANAGYDTEMTYPDWLYKAFKHDVMIDLIFRSEGNITVDDETLSRARRVSYRGRSFPVVPPEVLMLMKVFALHTTDSPSNLWRHWQDALALLGNVPLDWDFLYRKSLDLGPRIVLGFLLLAEVKGIRANGEIVSKLSRLVYEKKALEPTWRSSDGTWQRQVA